jgi:MFS family permease
VVITYILTDSCLLLPAGRLADRLGHRRVFCAGLAVTGLGLLLCGVAPSFGWLLVARGIQGLGAALVYATAPALVTLAAPESRRRGALGWYNLAFGIAATLGPLLGGVLVALWGWRGVYLARVPLAAAALILGWSGLPAARPAERGPSRPAGVIDRRTFVVANAVNLVAHAGVFFVWLLVPYYLIDIRGVPAIGAGLLFAAGSLAAAIGAPIGARCAEGWGARRVVAVALGLEVAGLALTSRLDAGSASAPIALALVLSGFGVGLFTVPNMHYVMGALPPGRQGEAGSLVMLMRMGGFVLGAQAAGWLWTRVGFHNALLAAAAIAASALLLSLLPGRRIVDPGAFRSTTG